MLGRSRTWPGLSQKSILKENHQFKPMVINGNSGLWDSLRSPNLWRILAAGSNKKVGQYIIHGAWWTLVFKICLWYHYQSWVNLRTLEGIPLKLEEWPPVDTNLGCSHKISFFWPTGASDWQQFAWYNISGQNFARIRTNTF